MNVLNRRKEFIINSLYFAIVAGIVFAVLKFTGKYMMPFVVGFIIAFLLKPFVRRLVDKFGDKKWLSLIVVIAFYAFFAFITFWIFVSVFAGIQKLAQVLPPVYNNTIYPAVVKLIDNLGRYIKNLDPEILSIIDDITQSVLRGLEGVFKAISSGALNFLTKVVAAVPSLLVSILIAIISSFFFTLDYQDIVNNTLEVLPKRVSELLLDIKSGLVSVLGKYAKAYLKIMSLTFVELAVGFLILGVDNAIGLAALIAMVDILPVLGTGGVMIPWVIVEALRANYSFAIALLVLYLVITIIRNIIEPKIVGDQIGLHPLVTLMSIYVGVKLFGFWGLLGLPIAITIIKSLHDEGKINFIREISNKGIDKES